MKPETFDIDLELKNWRKALLKYHSIDPEFAEELASGLQDRYEDLLKQGYNPEEAFSLAKSRTIADPSELAQEISHAKGGFGSLPYLIPNYLNQALELT